MGNRSREPPVAPGLVFVVSLGVILVESSCGGPSHTRYAGASDKDYGKDLLPRFEPRQKFEDRAQRFEIPRYLIQALCELEGMDQDLSAYGEREGVLRKKLRWRFHEVRQALREAMAETPRARSIVENLNGRLRAYFFLHRHIGPEYLDLLRFFLNHRPFMRSERPERGSKSPAELLTGQAHAHGLELLGYRRFQLN